MREYHEQLCKDFANEYQKGNNAVYEINCMIKYLAEVRKENVKEVKEIKTKRINIAAAAVFFIVLCLSGSIFTARHHGYYFNVLVDDLGYLDRFECFRYVNSLDRIVFIGSSGPSELKKKPGRVIEIWDIEESVEISNITEVEE